MSTNYTEHLGLPLWEADDPVLRTEFNDLNRKLDQSISARPCVAVGSYVGTGTYGEKNPNRLTFDFEPKLVVIRQDAQSGMRTGATFVAGQTSSAGDGFFGDSVDTYQLILNWEGNALSWHTTNQSVMMAERQLNSLGSTYRYFAMG